MDWPFNTQDVSHKHWIRLNELNDFFNKKNCEIIIGNKKIEEVSNISKRYGEVDKTRIEAENKEAVKKRIYIGIGIILAGVGIILITNKK